MKNGNTVEVKKSTSLSKNGSQDKALEEMRIDKVVTTIIRGLDLFIAQSNGAGVGTVARILHNAKEDLVYWAINMNFHETAQEKFYNRLMYSNAAFTPTDFFRQLDNEKDTEKNFAAQQDENMGISMLTLAEELREMV